MIEKELMGLWLNTLASKSPIPGGGGASAIGGALAASGIILFFILGSEFFINYRLVWRGHHDGKEGK